MLPTHLCQLIGGCLLPHGGCCTAARGLSRSLDVLRVCDEQEQLGAAVGPPCRYAAAAETLWQVEPHLVTRLHYSTLGNA